VTAAWGVWAVDGDHRTRVATIDGSQGLDDALNVASSCAIQPGGANRYDVEPAQPSEGAV
jgi:hypothetical protein